MVPWEIESSSRYWPRSLLRFDTCSRITEVQRPTAHVFPETRISASSVSTWDTDHLWICASRKSLFAWNFEGGSANQELHARCTDFLIRARSSDSGPLRDSSQKIVRSRQRLLVSWLPDDCLAKTCYGVQYWKWKTALNSVKDEQITKQHRSRYVCANTKSARNSSIRRSCNQTSCRSKNRRPKGTIVKQNTLFFVEIEGEELWILKSEIWVLTRHIQRIDKAQLCIDKANDLLCVWACLLHPNHMSCSIEAKWLENRFECKQWNSEYNTGTAKTANRCSTTSG